ncbi:Golgi matrix protein [Mucor ambiguus]|uniref:Golgi matrix protein n=1 Tax=Mucor ambiguus TaxID=91626 RepID=A0A0C9LWB6_9FUNG|nr:Golgi matrix protein [Mucor ambiguus]
MSAATTEDATVLKTRLDEYEKKYKEEHAQLVNFQKKLTQAGTHLKSLAQENAKLNKSLTDQKNQLDDKDDQLKQLEHKLQNTAQGHQKEIKQLVDILENMINEGEGGSPPSETTPDVSTSTLLDSYVKSVQRRLNKSTKQQQSQKKPNKENEALQAHVKKLEQEIQDLKKTDHVETIQQSLASILNDPENGIIDSSLPPSILLPLEQVRSTLQEQQEQIKDARQKHTAGLEEAQKDLKRQITQLNITINELTDEKERAISEKDEISGQLEQLATLEKQIKNLESRVATAEKEKEESQDREKQLSKEHQSLLGKLSHIKETLTPRLEQDKQLRQRVSELTQELDSTRHELEQSRSDMMLRDQESSQQFESLDQEITQLSHKLENVQQEREEYEAMAMQLDAECNQVREQLKSSQLELSQLKSHMESEKLESESEKASLANLQTVLEEFQATKDAEMQAAVEHIERQLAVAKKSWAEYEERAHIAEAALAKYQQDVGKTQKYEQEIKEKNLLIGKLRHEAIILNEHLVEAMRKLKEETSESNVDRQLITNLLVGFLIAPRGDRKRYDILTIISNVLQLTEEQKEQIGLSRPKHGTSTSGSNTTAFSPITSPVLDKPPQKESFTDAWISFLLKESSPLRRNRSAVTLSNTAKDDDNIDL